MNLNWLKDPNNIVYADINQFAGNFGKETGIENLKEKIEIFKESPVPEGVNLKGNRRTTLKLFIPDLMFSEHLDMGENVWVYLGENHECYCLYWPEKA